MTEYRRHLFRRPRMTGLQSASVGRLGQHCEPSATAITKGNSYTELYGPGVIIALSCLPFCDIVRRRIQLLYVYGLNTAWPLRLPTVVTIAITLQFWSPFSKVDFYRAMHFSAKRGIAIACRLSVCPSVTLVNCDHIGWNSSEIISPLVTLGRSLFATPT